MHTDDKDAADPRLHELRHRYRNSLQIINSLVGLHARGIADPTALEAFADLRARLSILSTIFMDLDDAGDLVDLPTFLPQVAHRASNLQAGDLACPLRIEIVAAQLEQARAGILGQILAEMLMSAYRICRDGTEGRAIDVRLSEQGERRFALTVAVGGPRSQDVETTATKLSLAIVKSMATTLDADFTAHDETGAARLVFAGTTP